LGRKRDRRQPPEERFARAVEGATGVIRNHGPEGFASVVAIVIAMLIVFLLVVLYVRTYAPGGAKGGPAGSALDAARKQAQTFKHKQKKRLEQMQDAVQ